MAPALSQPLLLFCQAILLGMAAALLYDLLRAFRLRLPRLTSALDILYCLAAGMAVFLFMLRRAQGQMRLYLLLIYGFNHMIRFNRAGQFNLPVGNVDFNFNVEQALKDYLPRQMKTKRSEQSF